MNQNHNDFIYQLEVEKGRQKFLKQITYEIEIKQWWEIPTDQLNMEELQQIHAFLDELEQSLLNKIFLKIGGDLGASSLLKAPLPNSDQTTNPFPVNNPNGASPSFPHNYDSFLSN